MTRPTVPGGFARTDGPRIASLFSGTGALDIAVHDVLGGRVVWHSQYEPPDKNGREDTVQFPARILARHWPGVPNLGDITRVCWACVLNEHGPVDVLTGGFPCTDISSAGQRAGLTPETRSGLWNHMARAIAVLQPRLVVIENVEGLLSAKAASDVEPCTYCVGDGSSEPALRALGAVLGDLASLGFDAEWARVAASEVGAPHPRKRVIVIAWPAAADAPHVGHERPGASRRRGPGPADGDLAAADAEGDEGRFDDRDDVRARCGADERRSAAGRGTAAHTCGEGLEVGRVEPDGPERPAAERGHREPAADPDGRGLPGHGELQAGRHALRQRIRDDAHGRHQAPADAQGERRGEGRPEPAGLVGGPDAAERGVALAADADSLRRRADILNLRPGQPDPDWGDYQPAIRRWEHVLGRPAPWPTDLLGRLTPVFSEWMMGLPDGWVTCTAGPEDMSAAALRNAMLKALGNGVVWQQAAAALRLLLARAFPAQFHAPAA